MNEQTHDHHDEMEPIALERDDAADEPKPTPRAAGTSPAARAESPAQARLRRRAERDLDTGDAAERVLCVVRMAMFRAHPVRYILIIAMFLGGIGLAIASRMSETISNWLLWPALLVTAAGAIWFIIWWFDTHLSHKLTITNKRTIQRRGFFSRNTSEVLHEHIRNIRIDQKLIERICKVGRLRIDSAAGNDDEVEIEMLDVPDPHELKAMIDPYRRM